MDELSPEQPVIRDVVLDVQLPQSTPTSRVQVRRIRMLPDYPAGLHITTDQSSAAFSRGRSSTLVQQLKALAHNVTLEPLEPREAAA